MARPNLVDLSKAELLAFVGKRIRSVQTKAAAEWLGNLASEDPTVCEEDPPFEIAGHTDRNGSPDGRGFDSSTIGPAPT